MKWNAYNFFFFWENYVILYDIVEHFADDSQRKWNQESPSTTSNLRKLTENMIKKWMNHETEGMEAFLLVDSRSNNPTTPSHHFQYLGTYIYEEKFKLINKF